MKRKAIAIQTLVLLLPVAAIAAYPWIPDQGDGTFKNPIIFADYSDPDVVRVGEEFFMTASSFNCTPGLPILHSRDLVNWKLVNHALKNLPDPRYEEPQHGQGVWAPSIRFHAGKYWIFFPTPDEGIFVTTAEDPAGEWSEPHLVQAGKGLIDPCPLWDDDGNAYLVHAYAGSRAGIKDRLRVRPMAPDGSRLLGGGEIVFHDPERHRTMEGPKFLKKDGWYYILAPAGGVEEGWQVVLRSRNVYGPYEDKTVLEQGSTKINGPHQGALVDLPNGDWWFVHFQERQPYGRITHLQPVKWEDGWPLMGIDYDKNGVGEPVEEHAKPQVEAETAIAIPPTSDEFDSEKLGLQWQWHANHREGWFSLGARPGWLRLHARTAPDRDFAKAAHLLLQKFPAETFVAETIVEPGPGAQQAGLIVMGRKHATLAVRQMQGVRQIVFQIDGEDQVVEELAAGSARLRVLVRSGGLCEFSYAPGDAAEFRPVKPTFQAVEGRWIGAKAGVYSLALEPSSTAYADFDGFRFSAPDEVEEPEP